MLGMAGQDRCDPAQSFHRLQRFRIDERRDIEQEIPRRAASQRGLSDAHLRLGAQPPQAGFPSVITSRCPSASSRSVLVQAGPDGGTYCRSSVQIGHAFGGSAATACSTPQMRQIECWFWSIGG